MKNILTKIVMGLACLMLIGFGYSASINAAVPYTDVKSSDWYYDTVDELHATGIVFGFNNTNQFKPDQAANRGETAQFIANALNLDVKNVKDPGFTDVPKSHPYYGAIAALAGEGIINGVGDNQFNPSGQLQRVHLAKILILAFNLEESTVKTSTFADVNRYAELSGQAFWIPYVETLVEYGITTGKTATDFAPTDYVTRAELTTFLSRTLKETDSFGDFDVVGVE